MERSRMARAATQWLDYLQNDRRLTRSTVDTYRSCLTQAFRPVPEEFHLWELQRALDKRLKPPASSHVQRATYVILNQFFEWWEDRGGIDNPLSRMAAPPKPLVRRRGLTSEELQVLQFRLLKADIKDRAEVMLMLHQGFRVSDVVNLKVHDIDFEGRRIRCRHGKGGTDTWLPMGPTVADTVRGYLKLTGIAEGHVFTGPRGQMRIQAVWGAWQRVRGKDLPQIAPHQLRHTFANALLRGDAHADVNTVRKLMRHRSIATTQLYLDEDSEAERGAIVLLDEQLRRVK